MVNIRFNEFQRIVSEDGKKRLSMVENFIGGMTAGCFSTIINNPLDMVMNIGKSSMRGIPNFCKML